MADIREVIHDAVDADERARAELRDAIRARWAAYIKPMIAGIKEHIKEGAPPHAPAVAGVEAFLMIVASEDIPAAARKAAYSGYQIGLRLRGQN